MIEAQQRLGPETPHPRVREFTDVALGLGLLILAAYGLKIVVDTGQFIGAIIYLVALVGSAACFAQLEDGPAG